MNEGESKLLEPARLQKWETEQAAVLWHWYAVVSINTESV